MTSPRVVAVVQARLGSTRLPRKVLAPIGGRPMIFRIVDRLRLARTVGEVAIATTREPSDDELAEAARQEGVPCTRGPVDDLAQRLLGAGQELGAEVLVRVWGDCPLIDPAVVDRHVETLVARGLDFATNALLGARTYPPGLDLEVYRLGTLARLVAETEDPGCREFPVEYIRRHKDLTVATLDYPQDLSGLHLTVDYPEDLETVRRIYAALEETGGPTDLESLLRLLAARPELARGFSKSGRNLEYKAFLDATGA